MDLIVLHPNLKVDTDTEAIMQMQTSDVKGRENDECPVEIGTPMKDKERKPKTGIPASAGGD